MSPRPRPAILALDPYPLGESSVAGVERVVNLASNECAVGPSPRALAAIREACVDLNRYPDAGCERLRAALAGRHGLDPSRIVCGSGSGELIALLAQAYAGPGDAIVMARHGYLYFETAARVAGAGAIRAAGGLALDARALIEAVTPRTRVVFVDNPNNPTGSLLDRGAVAYLRERLPADVLLVLDAAYAEYVENPAYEPGAALVDGGDNTVMLRTFSKIHGLAGLRLGWGYCPAGVADVLNRVRLPNNVSRVAEAAGLGALEDQGRVARLREENTRARAGFVAEVERLGLTAYPSAASFVLIELGDARRAAEAYERLKARGVIARPMAPYGLETCLRFTVGTADEMAVAAAALAEVL